MLMKENYFKDWCIVSFLFLIQVLSSEMFWPSETKSMITDIIRKISPKFPKSEKVTPVQRNNPTQTVFDSGSARKRTLGDRWKILVWHQCTQYFSIPATSTMVSERVVLPNLPRPAVGREKRLIKQRRWRHSKGCMQMHSKSSSMYLHFIKVLLNFPPQRSCVLHF